MKLSTIKYKDYEKEIPQKGRHIIGQLREDNIIVYQAFNPRISSYAVEHHQFGGAHYKFTRMSWIKPNFLWMMYRAGWANKEHQQQILAIEISLSNFLSLLEVAVHSSYKEHLFKTHENWKQQLTDSSVRLQWDPDHDAHGAKLERRAIQLGLRGDTLTNFATDWIISIEDITPFVKEQKRILDSGKMEDLLVIKEQKIHIENQKIIDRLEL